MAAPSGGLTIMYDIYRIPGVTLGACCRLLTARSTSADPATLKIGYKALFCTDPCLTASIRTIHCNMLTTEIPG